MIKNPYHLLAHSFRNLVVEGKTLPFGEIPRNQGLKSNQSEGQNVALILAPHPDDECLMGGLPLRLLREANFKIVTLSVTLGSKVERRVERSNEMKKACEWIGFNLEILSKKGLEEVNPNARKNNPAHWKLKVETMKEAILRWKPTVLFFPHSRDWNQTHLGVNLLTMDTLLEMEDFSPFLIETEYWGQMRLPNLLVENSTEEMGDLISALSHHQGELERNPYHLSMPAWMLDNVRRGTEVVGGQGKEAPDFEFASLYRVSRWISGKRIAPWRGGKFLPSGEIKSEDLFKKSI